MYQASGAKRQNESNGKPKPKAEKMIRVEQIDSETEKVEADLQSTTSEKNNNNNNNIQMLTLPELDIDETSDSSSQLSPHTDGNMETGEDESIAVNCHTNPSEVIVRGKNVKQESVDEDIPYSKEETSLPAIVETPVEPPTSRLVSGSSHYSQDPGFVSYQAASGTGSRHASSAVDWDLKHRQDILSGLEYFERKADDLKDLYNRSQREIERLKVCNDDLECRLKTLSIEMSDLMAESDELKIKLDGSEKENSILQDQAVSEWRGRVKAEEMYYELQRDLEREIAILKKTARRQEDAERRSGPDAGDKTAPSGGTKPSGSRVEKEAAKQILSDETFELKHSVASLTEEIRRLGREKEGILENNGRLVQELDDVRRILNKKDQELESQVKRFLSLKKSFNNLVEENDTLKAQLRVRGIGQPHGTREQITNQLASCTWPAGKVSGGAAAEVEKVSYIDLPNEALSVSNSNGGSFRTTTAATITTTAAKHQQTVIRSRGNSINSKTTKPAAHSTIHSTGRVQMKRTKSEAMTVGDNLPPVNNTIR
ncbi:hypothetical protein LSH36_26g14020 [Paralvinella palmiformis]|uniref:Uncharacterized protein n=1 Tax=Paralvinella palmiformis TaxID=53620 RepID=A0AAD9KAQ3_9ANNE|nr:hypothetical protein LSH36_26g14020 [Paralvinella palmiformis]